jgi:hypothetical protein
MQRKAGQIVWFVDAGVATHGEFVAKISNRSLIRRHHDASSVSVLTGQVFDSKDACEAFWQAELRRRNTK